MDRPPPCLPQAPLPLTTDGVERYVWVIGDTKILIEVEGDVVRVNGDRVIAVVEMLATSPGSEREGELNHD